MSQNNGKNGVSKQTDEHIRALDPIDHVRMRPGMYVGGVDSKAMTNTFANILFDLVLDIRRDGCTALDVTILGPKTIQIRDNGLPLSVRDMDKEPKAPRPDWMFMRSAHMAGIGEKPSQIERVLTYVGAFGRAEHFNPGGARGGLGPAVANALSRDFTIQVIGEGSLWEQRYEKGRKVTDLTWLRDVSDDDRWTTSIRFTLDEEIFTDHVLDASAIENMLFTYAHLFPGLAVSFDNRLSRDCNAFYAPSGLVHYLEQENRYKQTLHPVVGFVVGVESYAAQRPVRLNGDRSSALFELSMAFQFLVKHVPSRRSFINTHETRSHGTHVEVCIQALRDCLLGYSDTLGRRDLPGLFDHLTLSVSLWHAWPTFQGSRNDRLVNRDFVQRAYEDLSVALTLYFKEHPDTLEALETLALSKRPKKRSRFPALRRR